MIVCTACGHENPDDVQFCEACQEYLEWKGKRVADEEEQAAESAAPVREPAAVTAGEVDAGAAEPPAASPPAASQPAASQPLPSQPLASQPLPSQPLPSQPLPSQPLASEPLESEPLASEPAASQPAARKPAEEYEPPVPHIPEPPPEPQPGELICDQCGAGNRAIANFCRRCGASLAGAAIAKRPSWWRRLLSWRRRTYAAGERRRRQTAQARTAVSRLRSGFFQVSRALGLLALVGIVVFAGWRTKAIDHARDAYNGVRVALFPRYEPVIPTAYRATSHLPGHTARKAFDKNLTSFWAEGARGNGRGQKLVARFDRVVSLARVGITAGDQAKPQNFVNQPVPHRLRMRFFDRHGRRVGSTILYLAQKPDFQRFSIDAKDVTRVVMTILTAYPSQKGHAAALTEVEFFDKE